MSYIVRAGNLAGPITLKLNDEGFIQGRVTVYVNDQGRDDAGNWVTLATTPYSLNLRGRTAQRLAELQERSGNIAVIFAGNYRVRTYKAADGTDRLSHDVWVSEIGVNIALQDLQVIKPANSGNTVNAGEPAKTVNAGNTVNAVNAGVAETEPSTGQTPVAPSAQANQDQVAADPWSVAATAAVNPQGAPPMPPQPETQLWDTEEPANEPPF